MNNESLLLLSNKHSSNTTNSPRVKRNKSVAQHFRQSCTTHTSTIPSETATTGSTGKMTKDSFALSKLKGMKWSAFASHTRGLGLSSSSKNVLIKHTQKFYAMTEKNLSKKNPIIL